MKKSIILTMVIGLIILFSASHHALASDYQICVFQESAPGMGDFTFLGAIDVFDFSSVSAAAVYRFGNPNGASYNGDVWWPDVAPNAIEKTSQLFVVDTNDGSGVSLFIVHDKYQNGEGGNARMQLNLSGDTAGVLVEDDRLEPIIVSGGGTQFNTRHVWKHCCTDGGVIGTLEGNWSMDVQFLSVNTNRITDWKATSADGSMIPLVLELERRVRLQPCPIVAVDIKPLSCPNPLNVKKKGVLPVAILGTDELDVTTIDPASVRLEGVAPLRWSIEDVATPFTPFTGKVNATDCTTAGPDGMVDLTLKFSASSIVSTLGSVNDKEVKVLLYLTGKLYDGSSIVGEDVVVIKKNQNK